MRPAVGGGYGAVSLLSKADPPAEFGEYGLGREIGRGASGRVYECRRRPGGGEALAVKALHLRGMKLSPHGERAKQRLGNSPSSGPCRRIPG
ncbi:unnamed protein product, partial [Prorocentrum cordatum]